MVMKIEKVIAALPGTLKADTLYVVRAGAGFALFMTDAMGDTAHALNSGAAGSFDPLDLTPRRSGLSIG